MGTGTSGWLSHTGAVTLRAEPVPLRFVEAHGGFFFGGR